MDPKTLWQEYLGLSSVDQQLVLDFIAFLHSRESADSGSQRPTGTGSESEFFGMWQDREDLGDTREWLRSMRKREWTSSLG